MSCGINWNFRRILLWRESADGGRRSGHKTQTWLFIWQIQNTNDSRGTEHRGLHGCVVGHGSPLFPFTPRTSYGHHTNVKYPDRNAVFGWVFTCQDMTILKVTVTPILRTWHCVPSHTDTQKTTECNTGRRRVTWAILMIFRIKCLML